MYNHYIALDWAQVNMAVARMSAVSDKVNIFEGPSDLSGLKKYLKSLKGKTILTLEESTSAQWLYSELKDCVTRILVCDPYRNHLLQEGAKNDAIDAAKLVQLLRSNLLKEVFHSGDEMIHLRKIVSGYNDLVKTGVRLKNQRSSLFRAVGKDHKQETSLSSNAEQFVLASLDRNIESYEEEKNQYEAEFKKLTKKYQVIRHVMSVPGIGLINAMRIVATVIEARRFKSKGHFLAFCGLIHHDLRSGGRSYGKKKPRYCPMMKYVFKTAALVTIQEECQNPLREYYLYLTNEKRLADHDARNAVARRIAVFTLGVMKSNKKFTLQGSEPLNHDKA